jgi:hypothetical protein
MPKQRTIQRARRAQRAGKPASTQAGEFVREQMRRIGRGPRAARSPLQAVAIGLSEARRSGVALPPPRKVKAKKKTARKTTTRKTTSRKTRSVVSETMEKRPPKRRARPAHAVQRRKTKTKTARRAAPAAPRKATRRTPARKPATARSTARPAPRTAAKRTAPKPAARRPARRPALSKSPARRPAARKPAARRPAARRPAPAPKRTARTVKFTVKRVAAAARPFATERLTAPTAGERAAARKAVETRKTATTRKRRTGLGRWK